MFQGDEGEVIDGQNAGGRRGRLGVSRTALHVLKEGAVNTDAPIYDSARYAYLQKTIHFLGDLRCQLGFSNGGRFAPPILRSHLQRWSDRGSEDGRLAYEPAGPMVGNRGTIREECQFNSPVVRDWIVPVV